MVKLNVVQAAVAEYVSKPSLVVVSAGGSSGIGETTLRQLCIAAGKDGGKGKGLFIYILGRNETTISKLISEFKSLAPNAQFTHILAKDLSLLKDVDKACSEVIKLERARVGEAARVDLLVMSQAMFDPWLGRKGDTNLTVRPWYNTDHSLETIEGIDINMCLLYYSRMRMLDQLLPLLIARSDPDDPAHVISVNAAGAESMGTFHRDDLSLRHKYGFSDARTNVVHMQTMFFEHMANDHPGKLSLIHIYPGLVITSAFDSFPPPSAPLWIRILTPILLPIAKMTVATPVPESGQRTLYFATDRYPALTSKDSQQSSETTSQGIRVAVATTGKLGGGAYSCKGDCEINKNVKSAYAKLRPDFYNEVWQHTYDAFNTIASGQVFTK